MQILYIAGLGRSGSTVLDQTLGAEPDSFSAGELRLIWSHGVLQDWLCACGVPFSECPFWTEVRRCDPTLLTKQVASEVASYQYRTIRNRLMYRLWWERGRKQVVAGAPSSYFGRVARLYGAIRAASGCQRIIDSSKDPGYAHLLIESTVVPRIDLIHLVRDPRAVAYSWMRHTVDPTSPGAATYMPQFRPSVAAALWLEWNTTIERIASDDRVAYHRLRYEDFVSDPRGALVELGLASSVAAAALSTQPVTRGWHTVAGNPSRLHRGPLRVREDDEWRRRMHRRDAFTVSMIASPLLKRYGYAFRFS